MIPSRTELNDLPKTVHGGQAWKVAGIEDYSHNLNPSGPPSDLNEIIQKVLGEVGHYPDDNCTELKSVMTTVFPVRSENIIIGAGSSDIIRIFPNTFFEKGDKVLIHRPSFAEYAQQCRIAGLEIVWSDLLPENDFRIDLDVLKEQLEQGIKAVYICNPNNPTGRVEPKEKIKTIVEMCAAKNILVFLDETLLELVNEYNEISCVKLLDDYDNLVIIGSLTKSFAIPGIRVGFGFSCPELIGEMNKVRLTWNVGEIEQKVATELIGMNLDYVLSAATMMHEESAIMRDMLDDIGFPIGEVSDSFFYFVSVESLGLDAKKFQKLMLEDGIMVRDCSSFGEGFEGYVRFSVKDRERNLHFVDAVQKIIERTEE